MFNKKPRYSDQFKSEAIELARTSGKSTAQIADELGVHYSTLRGWIKQLEIDGGKAEGLTSDEKEELRQLRKDNRRLTQERDILKKAAVWFAKESEMR